MKDKQELIDEIRNGLAAGMISEEDIKAFIHNPVYETNVTNTPRDSASKSDKLSAVDVMFYIAGVVLYSAIISVIVQSWSDGSTAAHILLSGGVGVGLWLIAYFLIKQSVQNDIRKGLLNALLLTGSLSIITGGYIITNKLVGGFNEVNFIPSAIMLAILGGAHIGFDRAIKKDFILLMGVLLCVASFPALLFGFLQDAVVPRDFWSIVLIITAALLAYATRVVAKISPDRRTIHSSLDSFSVFLALAVMYLSSFGQYGVLWLCALIAGVFGMFYLSIISQDKDLLGSASFFLVLTVITIAFKYFSGYGITTSLILATLGLLGSGAIASNINKRYFKNPLKTDDSASK